MSFRTCSSCCTEDSDYSKGTANCIKVTESIYIDSYGAKDPDFVLKVQEAIKMITSKEIGGLLIKKIDTSRHIVWISKRMNDDLALPLKPSDKDKCEKGSCTRITLRASDGEDHIGFWGQKIPNPFFINFGHELIHAYHNAYGIDSTALKPSSKIWTNGEEYATIVGKPLRIPASLEPSISENAIRQEHNFPARFSHFCYRTGEKVINKLKLAATVYRVKEVAYGIFQKMCPKNMNIFNVTDLYSNKIYQVSSAFFLNSCL